MTAIIKKGHATRDIDKVYLSNAVHKFNREALGRDLCGMKELIIDGDRYKVQQDESGNYSLKRFNEKYKMWVNIGFTGAAKDVQSVITEKFRKQYIDGVLSNSIGGKA